MAKQHPSSQTILYVRGEDHFRIAAESTPDQIHRWAEDWFNLWALEVCHADKAMRKVERFIDCSSRLAAVAELHNLNAAPLLTFIREMGEAWSADRIPSRSDSHLGESQDVVERVDSWAKARIVGAARPAPHEVEGKPQAEQDRPGSQPGQSGSAMMSPRDLAGKYGVDAGALRRRLERWRYEHDAGYVEVSNRTPRQPKYFYDESAVMPIIEALKAKPAGQKRAANGQRKDR